MVNWNSLGGHCGPQSFGHEQIAFGLAEVAAKIPLKGNGLECFQPLLQGELLVVVPKEAGIVEAGAQDALVAMTNDRSAFRIHFGIQHGQEMSSKGVLLVFDREILLVVTHHGDQNFFRQRQKFGLEVAA